MSQPRQPVIRPSLLIALGTSIGIAIIGGIAVANWKIPQPTPQAAVPLTPPEEVGQHWLKPLGAEAAYVGSAACKPCHAQEFESHGTTGHNQTVRRLARDEKLPEFHSRVEVVDQTAQAVYRLQPAGDANRLLAFRPDKRSGWSRTGCSAPARTPRPTWRKARSATSSCASPTTRR